MQELEEAAAGLLHNPNTDPAMLEMRVAAKLKFAHNQHYEPK